MLAAATKFGFFRQHVTRMLTDLPMLDFVVREAEAFTEPQPKKRSSPGPSGHANPLYSSGGEHSIALSRRAGKQLTLVWFAHSRVMISMCWSIRKIELPLLSGWNRLVSDRTLRLNLFQNSRLDFNGSLNRLHSQVQSINTFVQIVQPPVRFTAAIVSWSLIRHGACLRGRSHHRHTHSHHHGHCHHHGHLLHHRIALNNRPRGCRTRC